MVDDCTAAEDEGIIVMGRWWGKNAVLAVVVKGSLLFLMMWKMW